MAAMTSAEKLWNERLGHAHNDSIRDLSRKEALKGLTLKGLPLTIEECGGHVQGSNIGRQ